VRAVIIAGYSTSWRSFDLHHEPGEQVECCVSCVPLKFGVAEVCINIINDSGGGCLSNLVALWLDS
jgi:hypothetical protein